MRFVDDWLHSLGDVGTDAAQKAMTNLPVDDLDRGLERFIDECFPVDVERERWDFGKVGWITIRKQIVSVLAACRN